MGREGKKGPDWGPLEARAGGLGRTLLRVTVPMPFMARMLVSPHDHVEVVMGRVLIGLYVLAWVRLIALHLKRRSLGVLARLDESGITLTGGRVVAWAEIAEVRVTAKSGSEALAFVPRAGAEAPPLLPAASPEQREKQAARSTKTWGSPLVLFPAHLDVSRTRIIDAVRRFGGGVPVLDAQREIVGG